jgi:flavodoxin
MVDPYATHQKALIDALFDNPGPVLELGCGDYSTPIIRSITKSRGNTFNIVSSSEEWGSKYINQCDNLNIIKDWTKWEPNEEYSVCLLDNEQVTWKRYEHLPTLLKVCKCVVIHDADRYNNFTGWKELLETHKHVWYKESLPHTVTIYSNNFYTNKKYVLVYKTGGEFTHNHVNWLISQLDGDVYVLTDSHMFDINRGNIIEMKHNWPGWWSKMEMFRPDILKFPFIYIDLDTVVRDIPSDWFQGKELVTPKPFSSRDSLQSGFMFVPTEVKQQIWSKWILDPQKHITEYRGDQDFIAVNINKVNYFPINDISSFKFTPERTNNAKVICFHGKPRPWDVIKTDDNDWIPKFENINTSKKTYIVVGNGPSILKKEYGSKIDEFDEVIRINTFKTTGLEKCTGSKTTAWVTFGKKTLPQDPIRPKNVIMVHEESDPPYTPTKIWRVPRSYYNDIRKELQEKTSKTDKAAGIIPSTGYLTIRWLLDHNIDVTIIGFDHFSKKDSGMHHYWDSRTFIQPVEHDGDLERGLLQPYVTSGRIKYLDDC